MSDDIRNKQMEKIAVDLLYRAGDCKDQELAMLMHIAAEIILIFVKAFRKA